MVVAPLTDLYQILAVGRDPRCRGRKLQAVLRGPEEKAIESCPRYHWSLNDSIGQISCAQEIFGCGLVIALVNAEVRRKQAQESAAYQRVETIVSDE